jgi:hypothetical protein
MVDKAVEVVSRDPADHTDLPGFAHGLTRARLREAFDQHVPEPQYFTVELRVVSKTALRCPGVAHIADNPTGQG